LIHEGKSALLARRAPTPTILGEGENMSGMRTALPAGLLAGLVGLLGCSSNTNKSSGTQPDTPRVGSTVKTTYRSKEGNVSVETRTMPPGGREPRDMIVGVWEVVRGTDMPQGSILEFSKDGKLRKTLKEKGNDLTTAGSFEVDVNKLTMKTKHEGKEEEEIATITRLTDNALTYQKEKGKTAELKRK
jgi:uncharacterized protein (TIGR03066 family)